MSTNVKTRNPLVDLLSVSFGVGAWVAINGIWVELPLLVSDLPESWSLASYMSVTIQIANFGPLCYLLFHMMRPSIGYPPIIYGLLTIGTLASILLTQLWDTTTIIGDVDHSTGLLILLFFLALVDCTSSVLYVPYMASWKTVYISSYLVGEGLSGLLPALLALGQGVGGNAKCQNETYANGTTHWSQSPLEPRFSIEIFFWSIFVMMAISATGFICLEWLPNVQWERAPIAETDNTKKERDAFASQSTTELVEKTEPAVGKTSFVLLLIFQCWASMLSNGALPSIQSYSCGPYGNVAFHLAVSLSALANPIAAFSTMFIPRSSTSVVGSLTLVGTTIAAYIISMAVMSPSPPLMDTSGGAVLMVASWVVFMGVITYVRVEIANILRHNGAQALFWSGIFTQLGSLIGSVVMFVLVNKTSIFVSYDPCSGL